MLLQKMSSTMPACFSRQRGLEICSPGPQFALHSSQSRKFHENSGLRGLFSLTPNEYLTVTFSFGRIYSGNNLTNRVDKILFRVPSTRGRNYFSIVEGIRIQRKEWKEKEHEEGGGEEGGEEQHNERRSEFFGKRENFVTFLINNAEWKLKFFIKIYPEILLYGILWI